MFNTLRMTAALILATIIAAGIVVLRASGEESAAVPAEKAPGRIFLNAELRITDGDEPKERLSNRIIVIDPKTGEWKEIGDANARSPRLSPDGQTIVFGDYSKGIWTCDADGRNPRQIFDKGSFAVWGADGKHLFVSQETLNGTKWTFETWQINADGSDAKQLTIPATDCATDVSPDGKWLATISIRPQPFRVNGFQIYVMRPDGKEERLLTRGGANMEPRFSPDGKKILYTGFERGNHKAWTVEIQDGKRTEIYNQEKREIGVPAGACWSPDGKRIAVVMHDWERSDDGKLSLSDPEKGNYRIVIMDDQGKNRKELKLKGAKIILCHNPEWR